MFKVTTILLGISLVFSCQSVDLHETEYEQQKNIVVNIPCQSMYSPPIKDKAKIRQLLIKKGTITADTNTETADKLVDEFIKKKQNVNKNCHK